MTPASAAQFAKLRSPDGQPVLQTAPGARFWRIALVGVLPNADGARRHHHARRRFERAEGAADIPSDITLDRVYVHGDAARGPEARHRAQLGPNDDHATLFRDIKIAGQDSQAIAGWNGPGDYTIENNFIEASGENILFGGADPAVIRAWCPRTSPFAATPSASPPRGMLRAHRGR